MTAVYVLRFVWEKIQKYQHFITPFFFSTFFFKSSTFLHFLLSMFVFPAFDSNYKTRKRTFKSCEACRKRKTKCITTGPEVDTLGCANCVSRGETCDLVSKKKLEHKRQKLEESDHIPASSVTTSIHDSVCSEDEDAYDSLYDQPIPIATEENIHRINSEFLKKKFRFSTNLRQSTFVIIADFEISKDPLHRRPKVEEIPLGPDQVSRMNYMFSIHAFTLSTPGLCEIVDEDLVALFKIYFYKFNSVFPVVFEAEFWELYQRGSVPAIIIYAMVLLVARDDLATPIMARSLRGRGLFDQKLRQFIVTTDTKLRQLFLFLPEIGDTDKLTYLVTHLLLCLNFKPFKFGNEQAVQDFLQALSLAMSMMIQLELYHSKISLAGAAAKSAYLKNVWWVLVIFDRLNAVLNGKSFFIKRRDFDIPRPVDLPHLDQLVEAAFNLEDTVVLIYRPPNANPKDNERDRGIPEMETLPSLPPFNPTDFAHREFLLLRDHRFLREMFAVDDMEDFEGVIPKMSLHQYGKRMSFYLCRVINIFSLFLIRSYGPKPPAIFDSYLVMLSESLLFIHKLVKGNSGHKFLLENSFIVLVVLKFLFVPLASLFRILNSVRKKEMPLREAKSKFDRLKELLKIYISELKPFEKNWWFVEQPLRQVHNLCIFNEDGERHDATEKRSKVAIDSLVDPSDAELVLPLFSSITSPAHYDEALHRADYQNDVSDGLKELKDGPDSEALDRSDILNDIDEPLRSFSWDIDNLGDVFDADSQMVSNFIDSIDEVPRELFNQT